MFFAENVSISLAFVAGLGTFFTPCILPLIPSWLTLISGLGFDDLQKINQDKKRISLKFSWQLFWPTLFFVLGFSLVFVILGSMVSALADVFYNYEHYFRYFAGTILLFLGLYLLGIISPKFLLKEKRIHLKKKPVGFLGSFIVGIAFAAGWTPCVGPVLLGILSLAGLQATMWQGTFLLVVFSVGLALPFLFFSLLWGQALGFIAGLMPYTIWINRILGLLLILLSVLFFSGYLTILNQYLVN